MRRALVLAAAVLGVCAVAIVVPGTGRGQGEPLPRPVPVLGTADAEMTLLGATSGEAWGFRTMSPDLPPPAGVPYGPQPEGRQLSQLAFLRARSIDGWAIADVSRDEAGNPVRGVTPNPSAAGMTAAGTGLLVGRRATKPSGEQLVVLVRDPAGAWRERELPARTGPDPALETGEELAGDQGLGRVLAAPYDAADGRGGALVAAVGRPIERAVLRYDGVAWSREELELPSGITSARILSVRAAGLDAAYALVRTDAEPAAGIELYRRTVVDGSPTWRPVDLGDTLLADRATPAEKLRDAGPIGDGTDALTVFPGGVWIDVSLVAGATGPDDGVQYDATVLYRPEAGRVTGTWCDAPRGDGGPLCGGRLGVRFSRQGYRSFAWSGEGDGTRVVTNVLDPGGDEESGRGTWLRFAGGTFVRREGSGVSRRSSGAFAGPDDGWLEGPVRVGREPALNRQRAWPVAIRSVLSDATSAPSVTPGALDGGALAVGADGAIARFVPGQGWTREFLLTSSGAVSRPRLRGVAWPEPGRAHAVGDLGAMWLWRADTGLWERDPAAPVGIEAQLMDVAFQSGAPERGFAVGRAGTVLRYDKTWRQDALPAEVAGRDITSVGFAAGQALAAAGGDLLVEDGGGWRVDPGVRALLAPLGPRAELRVVAGLPDGGAVAGGRGFVLVRDGAESPWRFAGQPLPGHTVVAAAPVRAGGQIRPVVSTVPVLEYPILNDPVQLDPNVPAPVLPAWPLPGDGYLLRETDAGWRDEQRAAFVSPTPDRPVKPDPVLALLLDPASGDGWTIGGWSGERDFAERGTPVAGDRARVQTAAVRRYAPEGEPPGPPALQVAPVELQPGRARFAVGGHAQCEADCEALRDLAIGPDRMLTSALQQIGGLAERPNGPRFFLNTGGRLRPQGDRPMPAGEARRYADLLTSRPGLPVFSALSDGDTAGGSAATIGAAMATQTGPFGSGTPPQGIAAGEIPGAAAAAGARTHYAFDSVGPEGVLRVVVIDNSRGSLAESDPYQNPREPQLPWLQAVLADAKRRGIPAVVMGSRDLSRLAPRLNSASDGDEVAQVLVDGGASAYFFERPEENRAVRIPSGGEQTIPSFGTGTLGYRSPLRTSAGLDRPLSLFGDGQVLLAEIDLGARDAATNVAPVTVRGLPVIEELSLQAVDGSLLRRSRPALFQGLGRRPIGGDRWGPAAGDAGPEPPGGDPYTTLPAEPCQVAGCDTRIAPEVTFSSSNPEIGDFVRQDPESTNQRKPLLGPDDRPVPDAASPLFCAFNAGTTTVTIRSGGLSYSQPVTVLAGSVQRPCGTRPATSREVQTAAPAAPSIPAPALPPIAPEVPEIPEIPLPDPPPEPVPAAADPRAPAPRRPAARAIPELFDPLPAQQTFLALTGARATVPPPTGGFAQPIPPGGVSVRVMEEKREEEAATEETQAFSRYRADDPLPVGPLTVGAVVLLALAGAALRPPPRARPTRVPAYARARTTTPDDLPRTHPYRRRTRG